MDRVREAGTGGGTRVADNAPGVPGDGRATDTSLASGTASNATPAASGPATDTSSIGTTSPPEVQTPEAGTTATTGRGDGVAVRTGDLGAMLGVGKGTDLFAAAAPDAGGSSTDRAGGGGASDVTGTPGTTVDASGRPSPIDPTSLSSGPLGKADYDRVVARNVHLASKYDSQSWSDRLLNAVTGAMSNPANVLTDMERAEHAALSKKIVDTVYPEPTADETRLNMLAESPLGAAAYAATNAMGGSQQAQDLALGLGTAAGGVGLALAGARGGRATDFLGAQVGETVPIQPSSVKPTYTNASPSDPAVRQDAVRPLVQDDAGRWWMQSAGGQLLTPSGSFKFVTMPNGQLLITKPNENTGFSTHLGLNGGADVSYAGSITFTNRNSSNPGQIKSWSNDSGHYLPYASDAANAGLPLEKFTPMIPE